jgi:hypothetical protein
MRVRLRHLGIFVPTILLLSVLFARSAATPHIPTPAQGLNGSDGQNDSDMTGGVATLYTVDPIFQSFCFGDGKGGRVFQANEVRNRCSDVDSNYYPGSFTVGAEGARIATIIDLGTTSDLAQRYGFQDTRGRGQSFASLRLENGKIVILKDPKSHSVQGLKESDVLLQEGKPLASAPVNLGHIYLVRITDRYDKQFQRTVKFMVIAYTPSQSVTIRWHLL